ncbi:MAG: hypothetical protein CMN79_05485 [Spirochaetales bacterium]|jgi:SAM-dependent methyltransferase|nr:hypothetical protein [Spirochaetales bacterium]|tara:strand:- start:168 stop:1028 length:861 start_codon:yes stop_codon:yes gene_type:complete
MKTISHKFFNRKINTQYYSNLYKKFNFKDTYPQDVVRLNIFISLIKKIKPKKIIDSGCGAGLPLIKIKKLGFDIKGYDKAPNMVDEAKINLENNGLDRDLIRIGDFENPTHIKNNSVDCILGMGAFYYSRKFIKTLKNQKNKLKKNGHLIFSLRNRLFDIATLNDYSIRFFSNLYEIDKFNSSIRKKYLKLFSGYSNRKKIKLKNIDDHNIYSTTHNPLTIQKEALDKVGLKLNGIYFYHFHAMPPVFESIDKINFRKESFKIENPNDWRGNFISSGFVVDCQKTQ